MWQFEMKSKCYFTFTLVFPEASLKDGPSPSLGALRLRSFFDCSHIWRRVRTPLKHHQSQSLFLWFGFCRTKPSRSWRAWACSQALEHWSWECRSYALNSANCVAAFKLCAWWIMDYLGFRFGFEVHWYARICCRLRSNHEVPNLFCITALCKGLWWMHEVEWNLTCQQILMCRIHDGMLPPGPIFGDIRSFRPTQEMMDEIEALTAGFPCQVSCSNEWSNNFFWEGESSAFSHLLLGTDGEHVNAVWLLRGSVEPERCWVWMIAEVHCALKCLQTWTGFPNCAFP